MKRKKRGTKTSGFGVSKRESHDSSEFYATKLYQGLKLKFLKGDMENSIEATILNKIFCKDGRSMDEIPDSSVHLMVTSPPYNVIKEYDEELTLDEYRELLREVFSETYRVLVNGGRACVNIANVGRKPYVPYHVYIIEEMQNAGFLMRGEIIWNKSASSGTSTAWGSWMSAVNPTLRDTHEYIMVFSKGKFDRKNSGKKNTISKEEFLEFTKSVWMFPTEFATRVGHPAPFPVELPYRLIQLYTFKGDIVVDPFIGSGTTAIAAIRTGRHFVGYDISKEYVELANQRIKAEIDSIRAEKEQAKPHKLSKAKTQ